MYINNVLYCFYSSDTEALEACFRLLHDDDIPFAQFMSNCANDLTLTLKLNCHLKPNLNPIHKIWLKTKKSSCNAKLIVKKADCVIDSCQSTRHTVNSSHPKIAWRVDRRLKHRVVTNWPVPQTPCCHCCDEGSNEDERTVLFKTISLDGIKPNTNTNPKPKLTLILTLFSCFMLFSSTVLWSSV